jgi:hypothetical protein
LGGLDKIISEKLQHKTMEQ